MGNCQRITMASKRLRRVCTVLIFFLPVICALFWTFFNQIYNLMPTMSLPVQVTQHLSGWTRFFAFLSDLIPLAALIYGLRRLRDLFQYYENGLIFTEQNVACFRSLGRTLIAWVICDVVRNSLLSIVLTLGNPPGQRLLTIGFYSADFIGIFVGIIILIIAWVMDEARKIKEEQALFI